MLNSACQQRPCRASSLQGYNLKDEKEETDFQVGENSVKEKECDMQRPRGEKTSLKTLEVQSI